MCNIISYGFTLDGGSTLSGPTCNGTTSQIIGTDVSISTDASDIGMTYVAEINLMRNGSSIGTFRSAPKYMGGLTLWTFKIPFTSVSSLEGTYTFGGGGCASIKSADYVNQYCYRCDTTKCTSLTITQACTTPNCGFTIST